MISPLNENLQELLIKHEGFRVSTYRCPEGYLTIGVGHNLEANPVPGIVEGSRISPQDVIDLLIHDLSCVIGDLTKYLPWIVNLNEVRQAVLIDMAFNLGIHGLLKFKKFLWALADGFDPGDSAEMFRSRWAYQVDDGPGKRFGRVDRLAAMLETGEWVA